jgi:serine/threonine-protein kinase
MGEVHEARDPVIGRHVAIKTISAEAGYEDTLRQRFEREAQSAGSLSHPNIVTVFDFGEAEGQLFIVMELLKGRDLKDIIASREPLTLGARLALMEQICDGLAFAHARQVVHRDLKPANMQVLPDGTVKIMDFGLARASSSNLTHMGAVLGTPHYMSPEQVRGETVDARSDVFSLGVVFYELLSGRKPFDADSLPSVLFQVLNEAPEPVRDRVPGLPVGLAAVLDRALAKEPAQRFAHAGEMREALRAVRASLAPCASTEMVPWPANEPEPSASGTLPGSPPVATNTVIAEASPPPAVPAVSIPAAPAAAASVPPAPAPAVPRRTYIAILAGGALLAVAALLLFASKRGAPAPRLADDLPPAARPAVATPAPAASELATPEPATPEPAAPALVERAATATPGPVERRLPRPRATPPPAKAPAPAAPEPAPAAAPVDREQESLVRRVVKDLELALVRRDTQRLRALTSGAARAAEQELASTAWKDVSLAITGMEIQGSRATVSVLWSQRGQDGAVSNARRTLELERGLAGWKIAAISR